jgi:hypothetical protein
LHNEKLHNPYSSPDIILNFHIKKNDRSGACGMYREEQRRLEVLVRKI